MAVFFLSGSSKMEDGESLGQRCGLQGAGGAINLCGFLATSYVAVVFGLYCL